jgi:ribulose 1,5-bisphosphate carboxylase large subunit-like protein
MIGGYYANGGDDMEQIIKDLSKGNVVAALSCGMHPGLVEHITNKVGNDYMANCGGSIHGHPLGTKSGVIAMRQAIDGNFGEEYNQAILKWGKL